MQSTTLLNIEMGQLWKVMLVQLDDPRAQEPYVLLRFGFGRQIEKTDRFALKRPAIDRFREFVLSLLENTMEQGAIESEEYERAKGDVEIAIQRNTEIMH